jgi:hypothetical protein
MDEPVYGAAAREVLIPGMEGAEAVRSRKRAGNDDM